MSPRLPLIWNVRRGFATNSSSSHSMLLLDRPADQVLSSVDSAGNYGWNAFTLVERAAKEDYLVDLLGSALARQVGPIVATAVLEDLGLSDSQSGGFGIDHQSHVILPLLDDAPNLQFLREFVAFSLRPEVAILGGNDNEEVEHPDMGKGVRLEWRRWLNVGIRAAKDPETGAWTLFSRSTGAKVRLSFQSHDVVAPEDRDAIARLAEKPTHTPELVDLKITDRCPYACPYCYQGSTPRAPHAPLSLIEEVAQSLTVAGVCEVALGGGEPTIHPDFALIVKMFDEYGISTAVTTRNLAWLGRATAEELALLSGVAISVDTVEQAVRAVAALSDAYARLEVAREEGRVTSEREDRYGFPRYLQLSLQLVVGAMDQEAFMDIARLSYARTSDEPRVSLTLLGYKDSGLGASFRAEDVNGRRIAQSELAVLDWAIEAHAQTKELRCPPGKNSYDSPPWLTLDTVLAERLSDRLSALSAGRRMYHSIEGSQSMYIDAVRRVMAPSSFSNPVMDRAWDKNGWLDAYRAFVPRED